MNSELPLKELDFPKSEYEQRLSKLRKLMGEKGLDALLVAKEEDLTYFSGLRKPMTWGTYTRAYLLHFCLIPLDGSPVLVLPAMERGNAESWSWMEDVRLFSVPGAPDPIDLLAKVFKEKGLAKGAIGMELGMNMRLDACINDYLSIRDNLPDLKVIDASGILWELRTVKSPAEIELLQKSCDITTKAMEFCFRSMKTDMTEVEALRDLYKGALDAGAADLPLKMFFVLKSGWRNAMRDTRASPQKKLKKGDLVIIDGGVGYKGYMSDFIRCASIGDLAPKQKKMYDSAVKANDVALENIRAGVDAAYVSRKANKVFEDAGYSDLLQYYTTGIGHGIGLEIHEPPFLDSDLPNTILRAGNVLCIEPFIYDEVSKRYILDGVMDGIPYGIFNIENTIAVTDKGYRNMTPMSKDLYRVQT